MTESSSLPNTMSNIIKQDIISSLPEEILNTIVTFCIDVANSPGAIQQIPMSPEIWPSRHETPYTPTEDVATAVERHFEENSPEHNMLCSLSMVSKLFNRVVQQYFLHTWAPSMIFPEGHRNGRKQYYWRGERFAGFTRRLLEHIDVTSEIGGTIPCHTIRLLRHKQQNVDFWERDFDSLLTESEQSELKQMLIRFRFEDQQWIGDVSNLKSEACQAGLLFLLPSLKTLQLEVRTAPHADQFTIHRAMLGMPSIWQDDWVPKIFVQARSNPAILPKLTTLELCIDTVIPETILPRREAVDITDFITHESLQSLIVSSSCCLRPHVTWHATDLAITSFTAFNVFEKNDDISSVLKSFVALKHCHLTYNLPGQRHLPVETGLRLDLSQHRDSLKTLSLDFERLNLPNDLDVTAFSALRHLTISSNLVFKKVVEPGIKFRLVLSQVFPSQLHTLHIIGETYHLEHVYATIMDFAQDVHAGLFPEVREFGLCYSNIYTSQAQKVNQSVEVLYPDMFSIFGANDYDSEGITCETLITLRDKGSKGLFAEIKEAFKGTRVM